ncbi:rhomboid family intramembrane serine protease [Streptococcus pacificus]|uniref:Rhomboid family intramembrane serine protease n=1 Tax=Streptococcus pacificus TaxID=2740577 RepID=A0ABS0ZIN0_9STRE|nr:rhomboid family intramembrane serine protease [Streptococcus pacificus]MBJ8325812.1 rhomboid family intramembrane serine protease [Streptococcus pacificus]
MKQMLKNYPATSFLLAVTILIFLLMQVLYLGQAESFQAVFSFGGMYGDYVVLFPSQLWRLVTPIFVHIGWEHFALNSITLFFLGRVTEPLFGSAKFLLLYLLSGIMGNMLALALTPSVLVAGASTSLFGLFAAVALVGHYGINPYLKQLGQNYKLLIGINLLFNLFMPGISIEGHLGGALGGAIVAIFLTTRVEGELFPKNQRLLAFVGYFIIIALLLFYAFSSYSNPF